MNVGELRRGLDDLPPDAEVWIVIDVDIETGDAQIGPLDHIEAQRGRPAPDRDDGRLFVYLSGTDAGEIHRLEAQG
jgi:hypothetical protein